MEPQDGVCFVPPAIAFKLILRHLIPNADAWHKRSRPLSLTSGGCVDPFDVDVPYPTEFCEASMTIQIERFCQTISEAMVC